MKIICNGKEREMNPDIRVAELIRALELDPGSVVVECDGEIVKRDEFEFHPLKEGSVVELIRFVGGG
ncbi:MAG: sulfur carrier protein ThiS [Thermodesulfobacteriota bacterium]|nr:sulfur carrier protein ThiS [Thermodesulfobacteriota bacterium]